MRPIPLSRMLQLARQLKVKARTKQDLSFDALQAARAGRSITKTRRTR